MWSGSTDCDRAGKESRMIGWECPKCGACYSPTVERCMNCLGRIVGSATTDGIYQGIETILCPHCKRHPSTMPLTGCDPGSHTGAF